MNPKDKRGEKPSRKPRKTSPDRKKASDSKPEINPKDKRSERTSSKPGKTSPDRKKASDSKPEMNPKDKWGEKTSSKPRKTSPDRKKASDSKPERADRKKDTGRGSRVAAKSSPRSGSKPRPSEKPFRDRTRKEAPMIQSDIIRLNKYLADAGVCSRREADELIRAGVVKVNGKVVAEVGTKVSINDKVTYGGQTLSREALRYVLLNKPKDYITTSDDPFKRKTVMELVSRACTERIYPVGRLDRNTMGLLLLTNDGELAKRLMHPKHRVKKLYHVELDKPLTKAHLLEIAAGLELEDGKAEVDKIAWVENAETKKEVGIELHSGKNRIVRRIFEHLGYKVVKLDRVIYAGLTKLNLTRGRWRHLDEREVRMLKMIK
jgi:23S rRNA pseudouridine2605 synthase